MGGILVRFAAAESQLLFFFFLFFSTVVAQKKKSSDQGFVVRDVIWRRLSDRPHIISGGGRGGVGGGRVHASPSGQSNTVSSCVAPQASPPPPSLPCFLNASRCCLFIFMPHNLPCFIPFVCVSTRQPLNYSHRGTSPLMWQKEATGNFLDTSLALSERSRNRLGSPWWWRWWPGTPGKKTTLNLAVQLIVFANPAWKTRIWLIFSQLKYDRTNQRLSKESWLVGSECDWTGLSSHLVRLCDDLQAGGLTEAPHRSFISSKSRI